METLVSPFASPANHPPVAVSPAILTIPIQPLATFTIFATDQDNDSIRYRLATPKEQFDTTTSGCTTQSPPGLSINNTGFGTWDTTRIAAAGCNYASPVAGQIWPVQFMIEDLDSNGVAKSKVPVDVLLKFVNVTQPAPVLSFTSPGTISASPGTPLSFTASAANTTPGSRITLNAVGLPTGATATNINQTLTQPVSSVFSWTPTMTQEGTYVIVFTATNDTYEQTVGSVSIKVLSTQPPSLTCSTAVTAQYNAAASFPLTISDPQGDAATVKWSVDGTINRTDRVAASSSPTILSLNQAFTTLGSHTISVSATNTDNQTSSCSTPVTVTSADQTITFGTLPSLAYGDANTALVATTTSGLPVTYSANGSCSVSANILSVQGVGTCSVKATQAGNATYNPAIPVVQATVIASRTLNITAKDATRAYGSANPTLTGSISGLVKGDAVTATYGTSAVSSSPVGGYVITPVLNGANLSNYNVVVNNGTLTVTKAGITVTANDATRSYGSANPTLTGSIAGLVNGDVITATYSTPAGVLSPVGPYVITPALAGVALSNYSVSLHQGTLTITKAEITVTANNATRAYGSANPTFTGSIAGLVNGDAITAIYSTSAGASSPIGPYVITPVVNGSNLSNYNVVVNNGTLTINKGVVAAIQISSSGSPVFLQTTLYFQATVNGTGGSPTGSISLLDGTTPVGSVQLVNGTAQLAYSGLGTGSHQINAVYSGDSNHSGATSAVLLEQIADIDLRMQPNSVGSTTQTVLPGGSATFGLTVSPLGVSNFPSDVTLSVAGLPAGATYTTSTVLVAKGSSATQVAVTIKLPAATATLGNGKPESKLASIAIALLLLPFSASMRRRAKSLGHLTAMLLLTLSAATVLLGLTGCGAGNGFLAQAEKSYTVTVTASTAAVSRSTTMQLLVQ
jgi:hypothetical protein